MIPTHICNPIQSNPIRGFFQLNKIPTLNFSRPQVPCLYKLRPPIFEIKMEMKSRFSCHTPWKELDEARHGPCPRYDPRDDIGGDTDTDTGWMG